MTNNKNNYMEKMVFAPGCALMLYKPDLTEKIHSILNTNLGEMDILNICCHHDPQFTEETKVINVCPGCDKRFENDYKNSSTISLWEILAENDLFSFPDYNGKTMSIMDACPTRDKEKVQTAIRTIIRKMNINLVEPKHTGAKSICCGDSFYDLIPTEKVKEQMKKRTSEMPAEDVIVYCVSCIKSVYIGGKKPKYLVDLLFADATVPKTFEPDEWHKELNEYMEKH
jgi:Fe-S oxidoreductase